jgi:Reverse transcriptase (RNA-dependent DNA polymerase)
MGDEVLVYRDPSGQWEGPFRFIAIDGDTVTVQLPHGRQFFRSTVVKPVTEDLRAPARLDKGPQIAMMAAENDKAVHAYDFGASRKLEIDGLKRRETFDVINRSNVPPDLRIFKTKWVDTIKTRDDSSVFPKSRLVAQNFRDDGAVDIDTRAPTITRMSQRLAVASAAMTPQHTAYIRDISQAYIESTSNLTRPVYLEAPAEMGLSGDELLLARKPLTAFLSPVCTGSLRTMATILRSSV